MNSLFILVFFSLVLMVSCIQAEPVWQVDTFQLHSKVLVPNKLDINPQREIRVWLPPNYSGSKKSYPVIYYIHNYGWSSQQMQDVEGVGDTFQRALERGQSDEFIFVVGDFTATHTPGVFFGNNSVVGRWWDHIVDELVPAIDQRYRTLANPNSRGLSGDYLGGYCAIRVAMERPGIFSSVYALHPVGTDTGERLMRHAPDWQALHQAKSYTDLAKTSGATQAFLAMAQSFAPNPNKPPFYVNFMVNLEGDELKIDANATTSMHNNFLLSRRVGNYVDALKALRGFMFDWGRYDSNQDHVYGNQKFTRVLDEYDIPHFAEEHRGNAWSEKWIPYGRIEDRLLPFFNRYLVFE